MIYISASTLQGIFNHWRNGRLLLNLQVLLRESPYLTPPPAWESGSFQKENSELFFQPIPGIGLLYTGCPAGGS